MNFPLYFLLIMNGASEKRKMHVEPFTPHEKYDTACTDERLERPFKWNIY
jgi:hypothetical protein